MSKRNGITWNKKPEPKFIREFKQRIAYKEAATVEAKNINNLREEEDIEREDEAPQIVQLKKSDLSEAEYKEIKSKKDIEESASSKGKILFKKPEKRNIDQVANTTTIVSSLSSLSSSITTTTKKQKRIEEIKERLDKNESNKVKSVNNKKLLSFNDDEEDAEEA